VTRLADKDRRCREIAALIAAGGGVCDSCRQVGISEKTFQVWRREQRAANLEG